jgi:hypothetical protein
MNRKDVLFSVFTTFCLCALMFSVIPIKSQQPYDPWADIDENGKINMYDIAYAAQRFNTAGDSTKNVNVTGMPYAVQQFTVTLAYNYTGTPYFPCGGYSRLSLLCGSYTNANIGTGNTVTAYLGSIVWMSGSITQPYTTLQLADEMVGENVFNTTISNGQSECTQYSPYMTEIKAPYCGLNFNFMFSSPSILPPNWNFTFSCTVYLRNE